MIKIYTTSTCPYCVMAKDFFKANSVNYDEVNVAADPKALEEMMQKSGQRGVPVIDINGKIIVGFDKEAIENEIKSLPEAQKPVN